MRTFDLAPLLRSSVGFDQFDRLFAAVQRSDDVSNYPPYNIEKLDQDQYRITMAVAGFAADDLELTVAENKLLVTGRQQPEAPQASYLHRGIARRGFERRFELAANIEVTGATLANGLLQIDLVRRVPEHLKPKRIEIGDAVDRAAA